MMYSEKMDPADTDEEPLVKQEPGFCVQVVQDGENLVLPTECIKESKACRADTADNYSGSQQSECQDVYRNTEYGEMECQKSLRETGDKDEPANVLTSKEGRSRCSNRNRGENLIHRPEENVQNKENCTSLPRHELDCICAEKQRHTSLCKRMKKLLIDCQHKCPSCGAMFPNISDLMSHLEYHRNQTNHAKKSKRLRGAEDVQVFPKKCKSDAKVECRDFGTAVKVKREIDIWDEESWSEPNIGQEMRCKFPGNSSPNKGHERNSDPNLRNHQPISTEQHNNGLENERTVVKNHQNSYQGENQSAGTACSLVKDPLDKLDLHFKTDTKEVQDRIASCITEFSMTNYIQKLSKCSICDDAFSLPELLKSHYMTKHPTSCNNTGDSREVINNIKNNDIKSLTGKNLTTEKVNAQDLEESDQKQKTFDEATYAYPECVICGEKFTFPSQYRIHILTRHATKHVGESGTFFKCNICGQKCTRKDALGKHMTRHTRRERSFRCETCGKGFYRKDVLAKHIKIHSSVFEFTCGICTKGFRDKRNLQKHTANHTAEERSTCSNVTKGFECPVQKETISKTDDESNISSITSEHVSPCENVYKSVGYREIGAQQNGKKTSKCKVVDNQDLMEIGQSDQRKTSVIHNKNTAERPMKGSSCNSKLKMENHQHKAFHKVNNAYSGCGICGEKFNSPTKYKRHILTRHATTHVGESGTSFKCKICGQTCSRMYALEQHMKRHTGRERSFWCETCGKGFYRKDVLVKYRNIHSSVFEYTCDICTKGFRDKRNLQKHTANHKAEERGTFSNLKKSCERPVQKETNSKTDDESKTSSITSEHSSACENVYTSVGNREIKKQKSGKKASTDSVVVNEELVQLGQSDQNETSMIKNSTNSSKKLMKVSSCNSELRVANYIHKPFKEITNDYSGCGICGEKWDSPSQYRSHLLTRHATKHVGESGTCFKCNMCGQKCSRMYALEKHMARHTPRERTFLCQTCGKGFYRKDVLAKHVKIHIGVVEYSDICMKEFRDKASLQNHTQNHITEKPSPCANIRKNCERPVQKETFSKQDDEPNTSNSTLKHTSVFTNAGNKEVGKQNKKNTSTDHIVDHEELMEIGQSDQCETSVNNNKLDAMEEQMKVFSCNSEMIMENQQQETFNEDIGAYSVCDICGEKLHSPIQYKRHIMTRHVTKHVGDSGTIFKCDICRQKCSRKDALERHMTRHTARERSFKCETCGKGFYRKDDLSKHMKTHRSVFEYTCDICMKGFREKRSLRNHTSKHTSKEQIARTNIRKDCERPVQKEAISKTDDELKSSTSTYEQSITYENVYKRVGNKEIATQTNEKKTSTDDVVDKEKLVEMGQSDPDETSVINNSMNSSEKLMNESWMESYKQKPLKEVTDHYSGCGSCGEQLNSPSQYKSHILTRHSTKHFGESDTLFKCNICGKKCSRKDTLKKHMARHTQRERSFKCKTCCKGFYNKDELAKHIKTHSNVFEYTCDICMIGFHEKRSLRVHLTKHISETEEPSQCTTIKTDGRPVQKEAMSKAGDDSKSSRITFEHISACENVYEKVRNREIETQNGKKVSEGKVVDDEELMEICQSDQYETSVINNNINAADMENHKQKASNAIMSLNPECYICGEILSSHENISSHVTTSHAVIIERSDGFYKCVCKICGKKCFQKNVLEEHMRTHTAMKHCICDICGKVCNSSGGYISHIVEEHATEKTGESGIFFECNICGVKLSSKKNFKGHLAKHTKRGKQFKCMICGERFVKRMELEAHQRVHAGECKYSCDICGIKFIHSKSVYRHMKEHTTNDNPYSGQMSMKTSEHIKKLETRSLGKTVSQQEKGSDESRTCNIVKCPRIESSTKTVEKPTTDKIAKEIDQLNTSLVGGTDQILEGEFSMTSHMQKPSNESKNANASECGICGEILILPKQLKSHLMAHYTTIEEENGKLCKVSCNICGKTFTRLCLARKHLARHTKRGRSLKCKTCYKGFFTNGELRLHEKIHSGVFEYACDICMEGFHDKKAYHNHMTKHLSGDSYDTSNSKPRSTGFLIETSCLPNTGPSYLSSDSKENASSCADIDNNVESEEPKSFTRKKDTDRTCVIDVEHKDRSDTAVNRKTATETQSNLESQVVTGSKLAQHSCSGIILENDRHEGKEIDNNISQMIYEDRHDSQLELVQHNALANTYEFNCNICFKGFEVKSCFKRHMRKHWIEETYACAHFRNSILNSSFTEDRPFRNTCHDNGNILVVKEADIGLCKIRRGEENHLDIHANNERTLTCKVNGEGCFQQSEPDGNETTERNVYEYSCDICSSGFKEKEAFRIHLKTHLNVMSFTCKDCGKIFPSKQRLRAHHKSNHTDKTYSKCNICDKMVSDRNTKKHEQSHTRNPANKCDICERQLCDLRSLKKHRKLHTGEYTYVCEVCGKGFVNKIPYERHVAEHTGSKAFECDVCGRRFYLKAGLTYHKKAVHSTREKKQYPCDGCGKVYVVKRIFEQHIKTHRETANFKCDTCSKRFYLEKSLKQHLLIHKEKTKMCDVCGKKYSSHKSLRSHIKKTHEVKVCICDKCGKSCKNREHLGSHMRFHLKKGLSAYRYLCEYCGKRYIEHNEFQQHLFLHKGDAEKPHKCKTCSAQFFFLNRLQIHERIHTGERPFACDICGKRYMSANQRLAHRKLHTKENLYTCGECGQTFTTRKSLMEHSWIHSGKKPYQCKICGDRFRHNGTLYRHNALVHKKKKTISNMS